MQPPQHNILAPATYIKTDAFDLDRVMSERSKMPNAGNSHPIPVYYSGATRYDLDAVAAVGDKWVAPREYLKPGHGCREWKLRRLRAVEVVRCRDAGGKTGQLQAFALAADVRPLTESQVDELADQYGIDELCEVGEAALLASEAPKASEKKA